MVCHEEKTQTPIHLNRKSAYKPFSKYYHLPGNSNGMSDYHKFKWK